MLKILLIVGFGYFFWLMLRLTLEYIPAKSDVSFLMIKQTEVHDRPEYLSIFYLHVYTSILIPTLQHSLAWGRALNPVFASVLKWIIFPS